MKVAIIVQARMGSNRLPGKVLKDLAGIPVLEHVLSRAEKAGVGDVVVATSMSTKDLPIVEFCAHRRTRVHCGSEDDVLDRFHQTARLLDADHLVRITADCPLIDPGIIRAIVEVHLRESADYTSNVDPETFPDGLDCEVFTKAALEKAWKEATLPSQREHVTPYLRRNPHLFRHGTVTCGRDLSHHRWTLDTQSDYDFLEQVLLRLEPGAHCMDDVLRLLEKHPSLASINSGEARNAGYAASLLKDDQNG